MVLYFMNVGTLSIMPINKYSPSGIIVVVYTKTITVMTTELSEEPDKMHRVNVLFFTLIRNFPITAIGSLEGRALCQCGTADIDSCRDHLPISCCGLGSCSCCSSS